MFRITCSILCYNYGRFLAQAIDSCLNQTPGDYGLEVLVLDDGSTDETPGVCARYAGRARISRTANQGFGATLTRAITEATGDYVCLLDADDYFAPDKIVSLLPALGTGKLYVEHSNYWILADGSPKDQERHHGGNTSTLCVHRCSALALLPVENEVFFHALKHEGQGSVLPQALTYYRWHGKNMTGPAVAGVWNRHLATVTHHLADRLEALRGQPPAWVGSQKNLGQLVKTYRAQACYKELEAALELGHFGASWRACGRMLRHAAGSHSGVNLFHLKMLVKTILQRPSHAKPRPRDMIK